MEKIGAEQPPPKNNVEKKESMEKQECFVCGNCEFYTDKIEKIHKETSKGVSHECPDCASGFKQCSDELHCKLEELHSKLGKKYKLEFLDTIYGTKENCEKCRALLEREKRMRKQDKK